MLNEAYDLLKALENAGAELPLVHPRIRYPVTGSTNRLWVRLDSHCSFSGIHVPTNDEWSSVWTMIRTSDPGFPVWRIHEPLYAVDYDSPLWEQLSVSQQDIRLSLLKELLSENISSPSTIKELSTVCRKAKELETYFRDKPLGEMSMRFLTIADDPVQFLKELANKCLEAIIRGEVSEVDTVKLLFVGNPPKPNGTRDDIQIQLAFDIAESSSLSIYTQANRLDVMARLPKSPAKKDKQNRSDQTFCMYTRLPDVQESAFPSATLKIVSPRGIPIFSMKRETPTNWRYGKSGSELISVSSSVALKMTAALHWVCDESRRGKTWRGVSSGIFNKSREQRDLFIAYVDGEPQIGAPIADFFGADQDSVNKHFEVDSKAVCDALSAIAREFPSSKLQVFVLRQVSQGQVQVVLSRTLNPMQIITGSKLWNEGAGNLPPISIPLPKEKGKAPEDSRPMAPYPDQIVRLLSRQWIREGAKKDKQEPFTPVAGPSLGSVIDLLVREPGKFENIAHDLLRRCLVQIGPLLEGLIGAIRTNKKENYEQYPMGNRYPALIACSTIGLVLHALNSRKEDYMQDSVFLVGKMLALADDIHRSYCEVVRGGSLPPSLLGNSLLSTAMENPTRAVAVLGDRLKIYIGWVKTAKEPQGTDKAAEESLIAIRTARNRRAQYEAFVESVHDQGLPTKMDDVAKAHLLLGYLASTKEYKEGGQTNE